MENEDFIQYLETELEILLLRISPKRRFFLIGGTRYTLEKLIERIKIMSGISIYS